MKLVLPNDKSSFVFSHFFLYPQNTLLLHYTTFNIWGSLYITELVRNCALSKFENKFFFCCIHISSERRFLSVS